MNPEVVTDENKQGYYRRFNLLHLVLCIVLLICVVFQFIAIVTPGWSISYTDSVSGYESVFYSTVCLEDKCTTTSYRDAFYSGYNSAEDYRKPGLAREYNWVVLYQLNVQITWFLILATLVFQVYKLFRPQEAFPRATAINIVVLTCAGPLMFQVLFKRFVEIDFTRKVSELNDVKVGFPYSFFFYVLTFAAVIASLVLTVKQILDVVREKDRAYEEFKVKFDRLRLEYDAEVDAFKRYRQRHHLRPESGGSYRGDRRSAGHDRGGSHSPRNSREIKDHDRDHRRHNDHSPRWPDDHFSHSRHSPRPRDRSPPRGHSNGNRSPRPQNWNHSPQRYDNGSHSPRNRSSRPEELRSRRHSPPRNDSSNSSLPERNDDKNPPGNFGDHENPALVVTPPSESIPEINIELTAGHYPVNGNTNAPSREEADAKTDDIDLSVCSS